ncbi:non-specific lipid-transfer protein 2-like [Lolium perenne]|uniref:non-specific lipid-transfer protein 2-like n=1 Tax=Lolium perenne TaxID=4522 RepID=UPI0021EAB33D|nr:non-specific lipid-transfer protein 2-like [Lolium perenne]
MAAVAKVAVICFLLVALAAAPGAVEAATCSPTQLTPCAPAIIGNAAPTAACCGKLKAHPASCLCKYKKDPNLQRYVNSPNGKKVFAACKARLPKC